MMTLRHVENRAERSHANEEKGHDQAGNDLLLPEPAGSLRKPGRDVAWAPSSRCRGDRG